MVVFGGVNSDEDLNDVALWKPVLGERKLSLPRNASEVLIQRPEGIPSTGAETILGEPFSSASGIDLSSTASKGSEPLVMPLPSADGAFQATQALPSESMSQLQAPEILDSAARN